MTRSLLFSTVMATIFAVASLSAQGTADDRLRQHADSLAKIRAERESLEAEMRRIQGRVRDISEEVNNISQQSSATARVVRTLDNQLAAINLEVNTSTANLIRAEDELLVKQADLRRRAADVYRKGPLHTLEVLFSASSFMDLIARYKYLHLQTARDKALLNRVRELRSDIVASRSTRVRLQSEVSSNLAAKEREEERFRALEAERRRTLAQVQQTASQTEKRVQQIQADEKRLNDLVATLDREARAAGSSARGVIPGPSVFRTNAALDWPVRGELIYRFGVARTTSNTQIRWDGIGISAPQGASVRAVADGRVEFANDLPGFGRAVLMVHASGDYSIYGSLGSMSVTPGQTVTKGTVIGTVGTSDSALGAHLHFEVRVNAPPNPPRAVDPIPFLKKGG